MLIWRIPDGFSQRLVAEYDRQVSPDRFLFLQGVSVHDSRVPLFRSGGTLAELAKWASLPNQAMVPLVSPRLRDLIDSVAPGDAQFVPAHVEAKDGSAFDFSLLNVLHQVSATDRAALYLQTRPAR